MKLVQLGMRKIDRTGGCRYFDAHVFTYVYVLIFLRTYVYLLFVFIVMES